MRKNESFWMADVKNIITTRSYKFQNLFLKIKHEEELQISKSNTFHSITDDGKKRIKKEVIPNFKLGNP